MPVLVGFIIGFLLGVSAVIISVVVADDMEGKKWKTDA